jgi:biotin carboxylase
MEIRILLIGHRRQLIDVFLKRNYQFLVWNEKTILDERVKQEHQYIATFSDDKKIIQQHLDVIKNQFGTFTHIIAGKEMAVIATAQAQMFFEVKNARVVEQVTLFRDKVLMKHTLKEHNVSMTEFFETLPLDYTFDVPLVFKERSSTGSRGIELIHSHSQVQKSLSDHFYFEKFIDGLEGSIESFILDGQIIFYSITKYLRKKYINVVGDSYSSDITEKILSLNQKVLSALKLKSGMTHLEFYMLANGEVLFGEVALRPPGGHIMDLIQRCYQFNAWEAYADVELGLTPTIEHSKKEISLAYIFHPGEGEIVSVPDKEQVKKIEGVYKYKLKVKIGDQLGIRNGVGEEAGHVLASMPLSAEVKSFEALIAKLDAMTEIKLSHASASDHLSEKIRE